VQETHASYSAAVTEVGAAYHIPVIDLDKKSRELLQDLGPTHAKLLFMQLDSLEHPNYPTGQKDNTHFNEYGARRIAEIVYNELKNLQPELADRMVKPAVNK
jgi:lysophospholipase L1-like esterase